MAHKERLKAYIPLIITSLLTLVLFFLVDDFVARVLVQPVLDTLWFLSLAVRSIPQGVLWVAFLGLMVVMVGAAFFKRSMETDPPGPSSGRHSPGPVEAWARWLVNAQKSGYARWRLSRELRQMTREFLSPYQGEERVRLDLDDLDLPEELRAYFEAPHPAEGGRRKRWKSGEKRGNLALYLNPEAVVDYLRERLGL